MLDLLVQPHDESNKQLSRLAERFHEIVRRSLEVDAEPKEFNTGQPLTISEIHTVDAIGRLPGTNINNLADHMEITRSAASQMVSKLTRKGLIEKYRSKDNAKEVLLKLTPLGWAGFHAHDAFHQKVFDAIKGYYGTDLDAGLRRLDQALRELGDIVELYAQLTRDC